MRCWVEETIEHDRPFVDNNEKVEEQIVDKHVKKEDDSDDGDLQR